MTERGCLLSGLNLSVSLVISTGESRRKKIGGQEIIYTATTIGHKEAKKDATGAKLEPMERPANRPCDLCRSGRGDCRPGTDHTLAGTGDVQAILTRDWR